MSPTLAAELCTSGIWSGLGLAIGYATGRMHAGALRGKVKVPHGQRQAQRR